MENTVIKVGGMTCQGCVRSVTRVLEGVPGVAKVEVSLEKGEAALQFDPGKTGIPQFRQAVEEAGFDVG
ncbi:MAG: heavy-metal-associated domain-containing protein [Burkholderiales bacterium]|nr:heavy-metal-associated domain-containing protein [Burkholderiales bacterium]